MLEQECVESRHKSCADARVLPVLQYKARLDSNGSMTHHAPSHSMFCRQSLYVMNNDTGEARASCLLTR